MLAPTFSLDTPFTRRLPATPRPSGLRRRASSQPRRARTCASPPALTCARPTGRRGPRRRPQLSCSFLATLHPPSPARTSSSGASPTASAPRPCPCTAPPPRRTQPSQRSLGCNGRRSRGRRNPPATRRSPQPTRRPAPTHRRLGGGGAYSAPSPPPAAAPRQPTPTHVCDARCGFEGSKVEVLEHEKHCQAARAWKQSARAKRRESDRKRKQRAEDASIARLVAANAGAVEYQAYLAQHAPAAVGAAAVAEAAPPPPAASRASRPAASPTPPAARPRGFCFGLLRTRPK